MEPEQLFAAEKDDTARHSRRVVFVVVLPNG
jgi:hypothetical protein